MNKNEKKIKKFRNCTLTIRVTAKEKERIINFAADRCINVSALVRKLLLERLEHFR